METRSATKSMYKIKKMPRANNEVREQKINTITYNAWGEGGGWGVK